MEVGVEERTWLRVRKPVLLLAAGLVVLGLIAGVSVYESMKGKGATMTRDTEAVAAERLDVPPPIDSHGLTSVNLFSSQSEREVEARTALPGEGATRVPLIDVSQPQRIETATFALG